MKYRFADGVFTFWCAQSQINSYLVFRAREDSTPFRRADEKGIKATIFWRARPSDVNSWLDSHPAYPPLELVQE